MTLAPPGVLLSAAPALALSEVMPSSPSWAAEFRPFSPAHYVTVLVLGALMAALAGLGVMWRGTPKGANLRHAWIVGIFVAQGLSCVWYVWPSRFAIEKSLPLELCDIAAWVAGFALFTRRRWLRALLFFWGFGLCTQAFITPTVEHGPGHIRFWLFWINHTQIVGSAIYDLAEGRFRPVFKDFRSATLLIVLYAAVIIPFDAALDINYGFMGKHAEAGTIVAKLGEWPLRLVFMTMLVIAVFAVLWGIAAFFVRVGKDGYRHAPRGA